MRPAISRPFPGAGGAWRRRGALLLIPFLAAGARGEVLTMSRLLDDPKMTPRRFAGLFERFEFESGPFDVQDPAVFLSTQRGDCIDYAVLANHVLSRKGYWTRLIRVELVGKNMGHAVCYVAESHAYLDYNNRRYGLNLERSGATIREIATKVAASLEANWTFAQEFTFEYAAPVKRAILTVVKTEPPARDADRANPTKPRPKAGT